MKPVLCVGVNCAGWQAPAPHLGPHLSGLQPGCRPQCRGPHAAERHAGALPRFHASSVLHPPAHACRLHCNVCHPGAVSPFPVNQPGACQCDVQDPGWPQRRGHTRALILCAWWLCVYLTALLCLEMRITAIFFHRPQETVLAALGGLLVFQLPTTAWLFLQRNTLPVGARAVPGEQMQRGSRSVGDD